MDEFFDRVKIMWEMFMSYLYGIGRDWRENRKPRAVGKIVLPLIPVALICALLAFLWSIREAIVKAVGGVLFVLMIVYMCKQGKPKDNQTGKKSDTVIMKHAKEGLNALLDHVLLVAESLAEQTEIYSPRTKGELAYPDMKRCIHVEDGVAVNAVQLHYEGEIDTVKFLERFNNRMAQKLNSGELPGHPNPVFYDKDNETHTAIQAIRCTPVKGQKRIILEVIRVNQAAVALLDKLDRESAPEANGEDQLYDDEL